MTLTITGAALRNIDPAHAADPSKLALEFVQEVATSAGLRIGAVSVCVWNNPCVRPHIHLLMLGRTGKSARTLANTDLKQIEQCWPHGLARAKTVDGVDGAVGYLAKNQRSGGTGYNHHGRRLLNRFTAPATTAAA